MPPTQVIAKEREEQKSKQRRPHTQKNSDLHLSPRPPFFSSSLSFSAAAHPAAWDACLAALAPLDLAPDDAEAALRIAFGWTRSTYWRGCKNQEAPDPAAVGAALAVLTGGDAEAGELGMAPADAAAVVELFPECLALDGDGTAARGVVKKLAADWKMKGPAAARAVGRTPRMLGFTLDCLGDCVGLCDRCWVRF